MRDKIVIIEYVQPSYDPFRHTNRLVTERSTRVAWGMGDLVGFRLDFWPIFEVRSMSLRVELVR